MGFGSIDALTGVAAALAVMLSAIVSLVGTSSRERLVKLGQARVADLCELSGILEPGALQDVFGPPTMQGTWPTVTLERIERERRLPGYLLSDNRVDYVTMAVAALSLFINQPLMDLALGAALVTQVAGWVIATRLPRP